MTIRQLLTRWNNGCVTSHSKDVLFSRDETGRAFWAARAQQAVKERKRGQVVSGRFA